MEDIKDSRRYSIARVVQSFYGRILNKMTRKEFNQWYTLRKQVVNGWHMSTLDKQDLLRLNHDVLEAASKIQNNHMLDKSW